MRTISSLRRIPSSGRRLLATAGLAAFAIAGATFSSSLLISPSTIVLSNSILVRNVAAMVPLRRDSELDTPPVVPSGPSTTAPSATLISPAGTAPPALAPEAPGAAAATVTPAAPAIETPVVHLTASRTAVPSGQPVSFTATAKHHNGTALAAEIVRLQRESNGVWTTIASAKLAANGVAHMSVKPTSATTYRIWLAAATTSTGVKIANSVATNGVTVTTTLSIGEQIVNEAAKFKGYPYVFGAAGPRDFDCSGLVLYVFKKVTGMTLPHKASEQAHYGVHVSGKDAKPGDLIFFHLSNGYVHHVAIYAGNGMMWEAPHTGARVRLVMIWSNAIEFRRLTS